MTHEQKYRDAAWRMVEALNSHCRVHSDGGYLPITNVDEVPTVKQQHKRQSTTSFLSGTLKYLYLTFANDSVLPLQQWVFNAQGHPLPVMM